MAHPGSAAEAQVNFINASAQLFGDLSYNGKAYILTDRKDTTYQSVFLPYFSRDNKFQYPSTAYNASLTQSWITYLNLAPGTHQFILVDTSHYLRVKDNINLKINAPVSIYYTDSLGYFKSFIFQDQLINEPANVRLRFLDFSPDAGNVFFTIDEKPASSRGFIKSLKYGGVTSFVSYPNPKTDTLRINFYQATDSTTIIARTFLQAEPGHSYTLALTGYYSPFVSYPDPKNSNNYKNITGGLSVLVNTNN